MTTLADLKAGHPEWCWVCGWEMDQSTHEALISHTGGIESPVIAALIAKALEDEARIAELREELRESKSDTLAWCEQARCTETTLSADAAKEE